MTTFLVTTYENGNRYSIDSIDLAETVTGEVTAVRSRYENNGVEGRYAVMGDEQYDYVENTFAKDLAETNLDDPTINEENVLYLDKYGNMIAFAATNRTVDYIYVDDAINALGGIRTRDLVSTAATRPSTLMRSTATRSLLWLILATVPPSSSSVCTPMRSRATTIS